MKKMKKMKMIIIGLVVISSFSFHHPNLPDLDVQITGVQCVASSRGISPWTASAAMIMGWAINASYGGFTIDPDELGHAAGFWRNFSERGGQLISGNESAFSAWCLRLEDPNNFSPAELARILEHIEAPLWVAHDPSGRNACVITGINGNGDLQETIVSFFNPAEGCSGAAETMNFIDFYSYITEETQSNPESLEPDFENQDLPVYYIAYISGLDTDELIANEFSGDALARADGEPIDLMAGASGLPEDFLPWLGDLDFILSAEGTALSLAELATGAAAAELWGAIIGTVGAPLGIFAGLVSLGNAGNFGNRVAYLQGYVLAMADFAHNRRPMERSVEGPEHRCYDEEGVAIECELLGRYDAIEQVGNIYRENGPEAVVEALGYLRYRYDSPTEMIQAMWERAIQNLPNARERDNAGRYFRPSF